MHPMGGKKTHSCANFQNSPRMTRREVLRLGGISGLALSLPDLLRAQAVSSPSGRQGARIFGQAKSVIVLYLHGGHAQQETWDPKPDGPAPARGEFDAIATSVPGVRVSEILPHSARLMHKLTVIRSLCHGNANHVQASLAAMTGHAHPPATESRGDFPPSANDFPPFGAVLSQLNSTVAQDSVPVSAGQERNPVPRSPNAERGVYGLPTWAQIGPLMRRNNGTVLHGQLPGFLGVRHSPFSVDQDLLPTDVRIEAASTDAGVPALRLRDRGTLLEQVDRQRRALDRAAELENFDAFHRRAFNLLTSPATARAFDLAAEPAAVRARYGRTQFGQRCLLARRLAQAGVPLINVHFCHTPEGSWDTHSRHFSQMKEFLCPIFDRAFAALVEDLDQRGLLAETLVLATAEFGRTPRVNNAAGRDHWPWVYSVAMAGGGTRPGTVYGASDGIAAYPTDRPHDPRDLAATVYHLLGVPPETMVYDQTNRPHPLIIGQKIDGL
ncbi:MAG: DUF1501 domain-containing protein, partial [Gemmataceae bacterium]|nr:DUF1501 domain-containing protein [Gemmataceae bacterium]